MSLYAALDDLHDIGAIGEMHSGFTSGPRASHSEATLASEE
jgi:hypothetical protein